MTAPASLQAAFAAATGRRACARCRGTGQLPARRKADAVACPDCARAVVSPSPAKPRVYVRATESEVSEQLACRGYSQRCACARCIARREEYAAYDREVYARAVAQSLADERFARRGLR